jgi:nucleoside phosphorylase
MDKFEKLFGIKKSEIKKTCVLLPYVSKKMLECFKIKPLKKGLLYASINNQFFTLIHTRTSAPLTGDAVLYLDQTLCENIILFGSSGLIKDDSGLKIGSLVAPSKSYCLESFTRMLLEKNNCEVLYPDKNLFQKLIASDKKKKVSPVICGSVGSLKLEENYKDFFNQKKIEVVDMEAAAFFSAAKHINRPAIAVFFISDIINKKPFYKDLNRSEATCLSRGVESGVNIICEFIKKNLDV